MPIYEYQCQICNTKFEAMRAMKDADAAIECKVCHSLDTKRALSVCFSKGEFHSSSSNSGCSGCHGGSCTSCGH